MKFNAHTTILLAALISVTQSSTAQTIIVSSDKALAQSERIEWVEQFGTVGFDSVDSVAADSDFAYATGRVGSGALPGQTGAGGVDVFLKKYDASGKTAWTRQFGTSEFDGFTTAVVVDATVYVLGITLGTFPGQVSPGVPDVFLQIFDDAGQPVTSAQFGTSGLDSVLSAVVYDSYLYVLGFTGGEFDGETSQGGWDFFVARLSLAGELLWVDQFGTADYDPAIFTLGGIAVDESGIYVGSSVSTPLPGSVGFESEDGFVRAYGHDGEVMWTRPIGTACADLVSDLALRGDELVVTGLTLGDLADPWSPQCTNPPIAQRGMGQFPQTFVQVLSANDGTEVWSRQFEGSGLGGDSSLGIKVAVGANAIYVASEGIRPPGTLPPDQSCSPSTGGPEDIHVRAYDFAGNELWTQFLGSRDTDAPSGLAVNGTGVYVGGSTMCSLTGQPNAGSGDAFLLKVGTD